MMMIHKVLPRVLNTLPTKTLPGALRGAFFVMDNGQLLTLTVNINVAIAVHSHVYAQSCVYTYATISNSLMRLMDALCLFPVMGLMDTYDSIHHHYKCNSILQLYTETN